MPSDPITCPCPCRCPLQLPIPSHRVPSVPSTGGSTRVRSHAGVLLLQLAVTGGRTVMPLVMREMPTHLQPHQPGPRRWMHRAAELRKYITKSFSTRTLSSNISHHKKPFLVHFTTPHYITTSCNTTILHCSHPKKREDREIEALTCADIHTRHVSGFFSTHDFDYQPLFTPTHGTALRSVQALL